MLRFVALLVVFLIVPMALYARFQAADAEKNAILVEVIEKQGDLISAAIAPAIQAQGQAGILEVSKQLRTLGERAQANVKLLLSPATSEGGGFFYVASWPSVTPALLDKERTALIESGILAGVRQRCAAGDGATQRYTNAQGEQELVASLDTILTKDGCWVVITSYNEGGLFQSSLARRYWASPEVQIAIVVYLMLAAVTIWMFVDIWLNLKHFESAATDYMRGSAGAQTFRRRNRLEELDGIAATLDNMVDALGRSAETIRRSAEENAHAFKAPIAVMRQSLDSLRRAVDKLPDAERRPLEIIDASISKLDGLVSAARALDIATADSIETSAVTIDLAPIIEGVVEDYAGAAATSGVSVVLTKRDTVSVRIDTDLLETALENLIENAVGFAPNGTAVRVSIVDKGDRALIVVADDGPGIRDGQQELVFQRYVSIRPERAEDDQTGEHFGIGLFVVRRNVELMGGQVALINRPGGGLDAVIDLPKSP